MKLGDVASEKGGGVPVTDHVGAFFKKEETGEAFEKKGVVGIMGETKDLNFFFGGEASPVIRVGVEDTSHLRGGSPGGQDIHDP